MFFMFFAYAAWGMIVLTWVYGLPVFCVAGAAITIYHVRKRGGKQAVKPILLQLGILAALMISAIVLLHDNDLHYYTAQIFSVGALFGFSIYYLRKYPRRAALRKIGRLLLLLVGLLLAFALLGVIFTSHVY